MRDLVSLEDTHHNHGHRQCRSGHGSIAEIYCEQNVSNRKNPTGRLTPIGNSVGEDENPASLIAYTVFCGLENAHQCEWLVNDQDSYFDAQLHLSNAFQYSGAGKNVRVRNYQETVTNQDFRNLHFGEQTMIRGSGRMTCIF